MFKSKRGEEQYYENLGDIARDATNLIFQLLRDRVLPDYDKFIFK